MKPDNQEQYRHFVESARELGADENPAAMDRAFERVTGSKERRASSVPIEFPDHLWRELLEGWVPRQRILQVLGIDNGVRRAVTAMAKEIGCVAERRDKGKAFVIAFHLRPAEAGEEPGTLIDVGPDRPG